MAMRRCNNVHTDGADKGDDRVQKMLHPSYINTPRGTQAFGKDRASSISIIAWLEGFVKGKIVILMGRM